LKGLAEIFQNANEDILPIAKVFVDDGTGYSRQSCHIGNPNPIDALFGKK
jgi:hypothetical protein